MAWAITRKAAEEDVEKLEAAAKVFVKVHQITAYDDATMLERVRNEIEWKQRPDGDESDGMEGDRLERLWKLSANRAIGDDGIAHGYVGHSVD